MISVQAIDGAELEIDENSIILVSGPYPHDVGPHTYVIGVERGVLVTAEKPAVLVARLGAQPPLAKFTRPDGTPVWVNRSAVATIRPPLDTERQAGARVKAVIVVAGLHQAISEDTQTAMRVLKP
jgi:hypothetical protein